MLLYSRLYFFLSASYSKCQAAVITVLRALRVCLYFTFYCRIYVYTTQYPFDGEDPFNLIDPYSLLAQYKKTFTVLSVLSQTESRFYWKEFNIWPAHTLCISTYLEGDALVEQIYLYSRRNLALVNVYIRNPVVSRIK